MRYWYLILILLCGCTTLRPQMAPCKTSCGVRLFGSNDCAGLQAWEDRTVAEYSAYVPQVCDKLFDWVVYVQPDTVQGAWVTAKGKMVRGLTWCREETMYLGTDDWRYSSYSHEVIHALECPLPVADHGDWYSDWKLDALKRIKERY